MLPKVRAALVAFSAGTFFAWQLLMTLESKHWGAGNKRSWDVWSYILGMQWPAKAQFLKLQHYWEGVERLRDSSVVGSFRVLLWGWQLLPVPLAPRPSDISCFTPSDTPHSVLWLTGGLTAMKPTNHDMKPRRFCSKIKLSLIYPAVIRHFITAMES